MSTYTVNTVRFNLRARASGIATDLLLMHGDAVDSAVLGSLTTLQMSTSPQSILDARWELLGSIQGAERALDRVSGNQLRTARELSRSAGASSRAGRTEDAARQAASADRALVAAVSDTVNALRVDERTLTTMVATKALTELGYRVRSVQGQRSTGLWAERGHHVVGMLVQDGGSMEIDNAGVAGAGCAAPMQELQQAMAARGVEVDIVRRNDHGDDQGGHLIQRACRLDAEHPELGVVLQFEQGAAALSEADRSTQSVGPRVEVVGQ